jgi:hypothetical protein
LHIQGTEGVQFYTQQKMTMTRWFRVASESAADPIWKTEKNHGTHGTRGKKAEEKKS